MQLSAPASAAMSKPVALPPRLEIPTDVPVDVPAATAASAVSADAPISLVMDELVPRLPGLPGKDTPGWSIGDLLGPPADGSLGAKADMATVKGAQLLRTPERDAWANRMADEGGMKVWFDFAKQHRADVGMVKGWLDTALLAATMASNTAVTQVAKQKFDRLRPYQVDPSIKPPVHLPRDSSYPSGHTSSAFAAARVIATVDPKLATDAYKLAAEVAASRVYAGVHFPTDVVAGALLGTGVADAALRVANRKGATGLDPEEVIAAMTEPTDIDAAAA